MLKLSGVFIFNGDPDLTVDLILDELSEEKVDVEAGYCW